MTNQGMQSTRVAALVAGAAVFGAGLGLLFSPQPGADTRRQIRHYAKKTQVRATRMGRSVRENVDKAIDYGKSVLPKKETPSVQAIA